MGVEIEAKMKVDDLDVIRERLKAAGAVFVGRTLEVNRFYDAVDGRLNSADRGLRLRTNTSVDSGRATHVVTMKGPRQKGPFKTREELEYTVNDPAAADAVFERLGFSQRISFQKRRESWTLDKCKIELDELPVFGTFVEIEGDDESTIEAIRQKLQLGDHPSVSEGYATMVARRLAQTAERALNFS